MNKITRLLTVHHLLEGVDIGVSDALNTTEEKRGHIYKRERCYHSVKLSVKSSGTESQVRSVRKFTFAWNGNKTLPVDYSRIS